MPVFLIGGAEKAAELDAKRAIDQGTRLAAVVENAHTGDVYNAPETLKAKVRRAWCGKTWRFLVFTLRIVTRMQRRYIFVRYMQGTATAIVLKPFLFFGSLVYNFEALVSKCTFVSLRMTFSSPDSCYFR